MEYHIEQNFYLGTMDVFMYQKTPTGRYIVAQNERGELVQTLLNSGEALDREKFRPILRIPKENFQDLVDALAQKTPPTKGKFVDGKLEGTEKHLGHLEKIVNKLLKIEI